MKQKQYYYDDTGHLLEATAISIIYVDHGTPLLKATDGRPLLNQLKAATKNYG